MLLSKDSKCEARRLILKRYARNRHDIQMSFELDDLRFTKIYQYTDVDLVELEKRYGERFM